MGDTQALPVGQLLQWLAEIATRVFGHDVRFGQNVEIVAERIDVQIAARAPA